MKKSLFLLVSFLVMGISYSQEDDKPIIQIYGQAMTDIGYHFNQVNPLYYDVMRPTQGHLRDQLVS